MNPLRASERIETSYRRYLATTFSPSEPWLREAYQQALAREFQLTRGPYLQAAAPYARGRTVRQLVEAGVLNPAFLRFEEAMRFPWIGRCTSTRRQPSSRRSAGAAT